MSTPSPRFVDALNKIQWHAWDRLWGCIGHAVAMRHNMRVMVVSEDAGQRLAASIEIADAISALMFGALALMDDK